MLLFLFELTKMKTILVIDALEEHLELVVLD